MTNVSGCPFGSLPDVCSGKLGGGVWADVATCAVEFVSHCQSPPHSLYGLELPTQIWWGPVWLFQLNGWVPCKCPVATQPMTQQHQGWVGKDQVTLTTKVSCCSLYTEVSDGPPQALFNAMCISEVCICSACPGLPFCAWKEMGTPAEKLIFPQFRCLP